VILRMTSHTEDHTRSTRTTHGRETS
jgi:hypothetical protein